MRQDGYRSSSAAAGPLPDRGSPIQDRRLPSVLAQIAAAVPGLEARLGAPNGPAIVAGAGNRALLEGLISAIAASQPRAGRGFWALRAWAMLSWQPALLTVLPVERAGLLPGLEGLAQEVAGPAVWGFWLPDRTASEGTPSGLVEAAGRQLREVSETLLHDLSCVIAVKPELARRLLADRVLGLLLRVRHNAAPSQADAEAWLAGAGLQGKSALMRVPLADGESRPALDRRACCLEYLTADARLCESCPRQPLDVRSARLRAAWSDDVPAV